MRHIYLINSDSRAAQYGIGTYIIQVINCLSSIDSLRLTVVSMNSEDGILTEKKDNNVRYLTFPMIGGVRKKFNDIIEVLLSCWHCMLIQVKIMYFILIIYIMNHWLTC